MRNEPVFVTEITCEEKREIEKYLRSKDACEMKRGQILLASSRGLTTFEIAKQLGLSAEYARQIINRFNQQGVACIARSRRVASSPKKLFDAAKCEQVKELLHSSPREQGKESSVWTMKLVAEVMFEKQLTPHQVSAEAIRLAVKKTGINWKRAKAWVCSPDPQYELKKSSGSD